MYVLEKYAVSVGLDVADVYCDISLNRSERTEFDRFLACSDNYDALVTKDFYHIARNTGKCLSVIQQLRDKGLQIYTIENGIYTREDIPFHKPLQVATYTCHFGTPNEYKEVLQVKNDVLKLFIDKKTKWTLKDQYVDESLHKKGGEQVQLLQLMKNKELYNLLLVHKMSDLHWRTANFCKIRGQLQLDTYSLQEGFWAYRGGL